MKFTKMQGLGNDFIVVNAFEENITLSEDSLSRQAVRLCDRRFGIGADGLMLIERADGADAFMHLFNSDGSRAEMCGNGIRCAARFIYDAGIAHRNTVRIQTPAGLRIISITASADTFQCATVDMGIPDTRPANIPVAADTNRVTVRLGDRDIEFFCVNTGVPHAVTYDLYPSPEDFQVFGKLMEVHPLFPAHANIDFARADDRKNASVLVWERGCGPTLACGTGSCAVLFAGHALGLLEEQAEIHLPGGTLSDRIDPNGHIFMTGPAEYAFTGEFRW